MIKLIASDMDGTLLDEKGCIPKEFFELHEYLKEKDIVFAAASGRQYYTLAKDLSSIKEDVIFIAENGTYVVHGSNELYSCYLDIETVHELIKVSREIQDVEILLCGKKAAYVEKSSPALVEQVQKYYLSNEIVEDLMNVKDDILKFTLYDFKGSANNSNKVLYPLYKDKLRVIVSSENWLDIINTDASKGEAIKYIQQKFNISFEETMAFGDYFNDIEMLQNAFHSYAMENAPEGVKKYAKYIAKSNKEKGVIKAVREVV
jgi:Cof subfamily protein (haloacid dehalogenase superfamily)